MRTSRVELAGLKERFGEDICAVLRRHGIAHDGSRDLDALGEQLAAAPAFRGDLMALCGSISHMAAEDLSSDALLRLVAICYGATATVSGDLREEFRAVYASWMARELSASAGSRVPAEETAKPAGKERDVMVERLERMSAAGLELKIFLTDVEQRVSELEPQLEKMAALVKRPAGGQAFEVEPDGREGKKVRRLQVAVAALAAALLVAVAGGMWLAARGLPDKNVAVQAQIVDGRGTPGQSATVAARPADVPFPSRPRATGAVTAAAARAVAKPAQAEASRMPAPIVRAYADAERQSAAGPMVIPASTMMGYALVTAKPRFPAVSVPDDKEGRVEVRATISPAGEVVGTQVLSGPVIFREAADTAMKSWRFRPYLVNGRAVEVSTTVAFVFRSQPAT